MSKMQEANRLRRVLESGKQAFGVWQTFPGANLSRFIARTGVDWIVLDAEHGEIDDKALHDSVPAIAACAVSPVVRIPAMEPWMIKRALDTGAHAILVPLLESASDARRIVTAAKFPPLGTRGFGSPFAHGAWSSDPSSAVATSAQYLREANDATLTIVQIETRAALADVDAIAAVPGIDVLFVGPFDLGNSIGHPILDDGVVAPELKAAVTGVRDAAHRAGKKAGIFCVSGKQANAYVDAGFDMVTVTGDMIILPNALAGQLAIAQGVGAGAAAGGPGMAYDGKVNTKPTGS